MPKDPDNYDKDRPKNLRLIMYLYEDVLVSVVVEIVLIIILVSVIIITTVLVY